MQRILSVFGLALMASVVFYPPLASAQNGAPTVDESISAILDGPGDAVVVEAPTAVAMPVAAAVGDNAGTVVEAAAEDVEPAAAVVVEAPSAVVGVKADAVEMTVTGADEVTVTGADKVTVSGASEDSSVVVAVPPVVESTSDATGAKFVVMNGPKRVESPKGDGVLVSMAFEEETLPNVVKAFRDATGANIISAWTNTTPRLVSMRLENVEWRMGLNALVASYGLELKEDPRESNIYVVREKVTAESEQPRFAETFVLKHAKADDISSILQYSFGFSSPAVEATNKNAKVTSASVTDLKSSTVAFPSANIVVVKATEEQLKDCRSVIDTLDVPTRQVYIEARFVRLSSSASKQLGMKWDSLKEWGVGLSGLHAEYEVDAKRTENTTYKMDDRVTTVGRNGVKTQEFPYEITKTTSDNKTWGSVSGYGGQLSVDGLRLALSAFEQMDGVQIFSNPKIIVENETTAKVDMTIKEPYIEIGYTPGTADQNESVSSKLGTIPGEKELWVKEAFFSYGISLDVTPRVSPNGMITVDIVPSISAKVGEHKVQLSGDIANTYPIIEMQSLNTRFSLASNRTAVIGGLTETTEESTDSGIPLLRKIPWIGPRLFGWKSRDKDQYEILVFVTVGIADAETMGLEVQSVQGESIGMPKNAVLGRGLFDGSIKEPGDRNDEEMFDLEHKPAKGYRIK